MSEAGESDINNDVEDQVDRMSIHSSELNSENLQDSDDEQNPHGFLVSTNLDTYKKSKKE